jgi:acetyltransferase-like isoleucine patch superfamily enzyme
VSVFDQLVLRIRRGDTAAARAARDVVRWAQRWSLPDGQVARRLFGALYRGNDLYEAAREYAGSKLLYEPMVRARFHKVGSGLSVSALPYVRGHARSGRFVDEPELIFGNRVSVSSHVVFVVNRRIQIGDHVGIAGRCWISDSDGHPVDLARRLRGEEITADDIHPLTIEEHVWIGHGSHVLKGVTIGRGAVVAAGSVVTSDVPSGALAMGVPARILRQPW